VSEAWAGGSPDTTTPRAELELELARLYRLEQRLRILFGYNANERIVQAVELVLAHPGDTPRMVALARLMSSERGVLNDKVVAAVASIRDEVLPGG
jgi:hypothetical protein